MDVQVPFPIRVVTAPRSLRPTPCRGVTAPSPGLARLASDDGLSELEHAPTRLRLDPPRVLRSEDRIDDLRPTYAVTEDNAALYGPPPRPRHLPVQTRNIAPDATDQTV